MEINPTLGHYSVHHPVSPSWFFQRGFATVLSGGEESRCLGGGGSLEDGDIYLFWHHGSGLALVTCHNVTSVHLELS